MILFLSTTSLTGMTGISLHWTLASDFSVAWQFNQREQFFVMDQTRRPGKPGQPSKNLQRFKRNLALATL
jgi:hypothetical protein